MNCPYCKRYFAKKKDAITHINKYHEKELTRDDMDAYQSLYYSTHGKLTGTCMCGCGRETGWNYKTGKPYRVSDDPTCRERLHKVATANMENTYGVTTLLNDMDQQKKMLANRHTSGEYKFKDGGKIGYGSKLELNFLKFCDNIMDFKSSMIQESPESFSYMDTQTNTERKYIPDFYLPDYNLLVEIKDAGNGNPEFIKETKYKVPLKDEAMKKQNKYNYIRINGTKYGPFIEILYKIVHDQNDERSETITLISEACTLLEDSIDLTTSGELGKNIHLLIGYDPLINIVTCIGLTDSSYGERWYITDYLTNTVSEKIILDAYFSNLELTYYRFEGNREDMQIVLGVIFNVVQDEIASPWDLLSLMQENKIYFTSDKISNNENKRMDFIQIHTTNWR